MHTILSRISRFLCEEVILLLWNIEAMPDDPEIETEKLHEAIHEELEREGGAFLRRIAMTTALLAAFAAVAALLAGGTANEALVLKTEATRLQAEVSDKWAYYQTKEIKAAIQEAERQAWLAAGKSPPAEIVDKEQHYMTERTTLEREARALEHLRDEKSLEADHLLHRHHNYAYAVTLFQVSIALGAIAALTRAQSMWFGSIGAGCSGLLLFIVAFLS